MEFPLEVNSQEELDALISGRLARAKAQWEAEGGIDDAKRQAEEAEARAEAAEVQARERIAVRDLRSQLAEMGVVEHGRQDRIMRLADLQGVRYKDGEPNAKDLRDAVKQVYADIPEVFGEGASVIDSPADAGEGANPGAASAITSEEEIQAMGPEQINSNWDRVSAFLRGER